MAKTPEGRVKDAVKKIFQEEKVWYYMPVQNGMGRVGIPDFIACVDGWFLAVETKAPGKIGTLTANQAHNLEGINDAGGTAIVTDDAETVRKVINVIRVSQRMESA